MGTKKILTINVVILDGKYASETLIEAVPPMEVLQALRAASVAAISASRQVAEKHRVPPTVLDQFMGSAPRAVPMNAEEKSQFDASGVKHGN